MEGKGNEPLSYKCTTDIAAHKFVQLDTSECTGVQTVVEQAGAGGQIMGITAAANGAANRNVGVYFDGDRYLVCDGSGTAIAAGDYLKSNATGQGIKTTTANDEIGGIALESCSAATQTIKVRIRMAKL